MFLGGCPCCGKKGPCWRCYDYNFLANDCVQCDPDAYDFYLPPSITLQITDINGSNYTKIMPYYAAASGGAGNGKRFLYGEENEPKLYFQCVDIGQEGQGEFPFNFYKMYFDYGPSSQTCYSYSLPLSDDVFLQYRAGSSVSWCQETDRINGESQYPTFPDGPSQPPTYVNWNSQETGIAVGQDFCNSTNSLSVIPAFFNNLRQGLGRRFKIVNVTTGENLSGNPDPLYSPANPPALMYIAFNIQRTEKGLPPNGSLLHQCFDAPPDEDGWLPVGKCHATEEECAEACGPCPDACEPDTVGYYWGQNSGYIIEEQIRNRALETFLIGQPLPGFKMTGTDWFDENGNYPVPLTSLIVSEVRPISPGTQGFVETAALYDRNGVMGDDTKSQIERTPGGECASAYANLALYIGKDYGIWIDILVYRFGPKIVIRPKYNSHEIYKSYFTKIGFGGLTFSPVPWGGAGQWEYVIAAESLCDEIPDKEKQLFRVPNNQWGGVLSIELFRELFDSEDKNPYLVSIEYPDLFTIRNCDPCTPNPGGRTMPTTTTGPGTELASLFKWFGIKAKEKGCGCKSMQKKMDKNGPQWCRDHKEEILDHLAKEAAKRNLPFVKLAASKLLDLAIRRAERG